METDTIDAPPPDTGTPVAATDASPWHASIIDTAKGELVPDWWQKAPEDERKNWEPYKDAKTPWEVVTKAQERVKAAQTELRNKKAADAGLPAKPEGESATPEAMAKYYEARGLPKDPAGYGIAKPPGYPDALWSDDEANAYAKFFHDNEFSPEQVKALTEFTQNNGIAAYAAQQKAQAEQAAEFALKKAQYTQAEQEEMVRHFGTNVDRNLGKMQALNKIEGLDPKTFDPREPEHWMGSAMARYIASLVKMIPTTGDSTRRDMGPGQSGAVKDVAYWKNLKPGQEDYTAWNDSNHPRHAAVVREREAAYAMAHELSQK